MVSGGLQNRRKENILRGVWTGPRREERGGPSDSSLSRYLTSTPPTSLSSQTQGTVATSNIEIYTKCCLLKIWY